MRFPCLIAALLLAAACANAPRSDPFTLDRATFEKEYDTRFLYPPPKDKPAEIADAGAGQEADARYLAAFPDFDRAYSDSARAQAREELKRLADDAPTLTHEQFLLRVARITALADNGHTAINENSFRKNTPRLPLRTFWFPDGLHILRASRAQADLLGARIDAIDGRGIEDVYGVMRQYMGGIESHRRMRLVPMLESPALLHAAGIAREAHALTISGVKDDGTPFERRIEAQDRDRSAPVSSTPRLVFPANPEGVEKFVSVLKPTDSLPLYLRDDAHLFSVADLAPKGLFVALGANTDADEGRISDFLAGLLARISREKPAYIVIDFRLNGGGDYTKTLPFMGALLEVAGPDARVYALTSPWTFSAAITSVSALKTFGADRVKIVGEGVGDRLDFWAEGNRFELPNAFVSVFYTSARHKYDGRCIDPNCFWLNDFYPVRVDDLEPDIPAPLTYAAYRALRDPALEAVLAAEAGRKPK